MPSTRAKPVAQTPKFRALILTATQFEDMEFFFPFFRLIEEGGDVDVAAPRKQKLKGENGYEFDNVNLTFAEADPDKYDILVLPGGSPGGSPDGAPTTVRKNKNAQNIVKAFMKAGKPAAAICHGPYTLISADVIKGRHLTGYWYDGVPEEIKAAGGHFEDKEVVVDGNLVTSRYPGDLPAFMRETIKMLRRINKLK